MATNDPVDGLKRFLLGLKGQDIADRRKTRADYEKKYEIDWDTEGENSLITKWQAEDSLGDWSIDPRTGEGTFVYPFAPSFWVDPDTVFVFWEIDGDAFLTLVWKLPEGFGFRRLTEAEGVEVSTFSRRATMDGLGLFDQSSPPT